MANFSLFEQQLLKKITPDLTTSLALIHETVEKLWAPGIPRIIRDFTDHGLAHYTRIADYACRLLNAKNGQPLSPREMYLLLAGVYLHDSGMQCDLALFPAIKTRAEELGASFSMPLTAQTASGYSIDEQKEVRRNHQYISAAWIDVASRTGTTLLGPAAKTIPDDLVDDLMDICLYHTKLQITDCPFTLRFDPTGRKQLVAALLRFADELDIDATRVVSVETIKSFSFDPRNAVYWWLHNRTKVVFEEKNVILLTIRLHPDDVAACGSIVHEVFIAEFQRKNEAVLAILRQHGFPIAISAGSGVIPYERVERLPNEIIQALLELRPSYNSLAPRRSRSASTDTTAASFAPQPNDSGKMQGLNITARISQQSGSIDRAAFRQKIAKHFNDSELRALCFDMGIDYEDLGGNGKADKIRELIAYCERRNNLAELLDICRQQRPDISW